MGQKEKLRKRSAALARDPTGSSEPPPEAQPSKKQKTWKAVEMDVSLLKELESSGCLHIEEVADDADFGIAYAESHHTDHGRTVTTSTVRTTEPKGRGRGEAGEGEGEKPAIPATEKARRKKQKQDTKDAALAKEAPAVAVPSCEASSKVAPQRHAGKEGAAVAMTHWVEYDLHPALLQGIAKLGFTKPTQVQARCLRPGIHQRKDLVGAAETGSGKTLAFGLPILQHTLDELEATIREDGSAAGDRSVSTVYLRKLRALAVLPTRELAVQVKNHLNAVAQCTTVRTECVVGGMSLDKQKRLLKRLPEIVVGTPGRIFALLGLGKEPDAERADSLRDGLRELRHLVLDEADRLVESGHFKELDNILDLVYSSLERKQQLQTFVFSATLTFDPRGARRQASEGGKVEALMQRMQFREARAVHLVDLTNVEDQDVEELRVSTRLPAQLTLRNALCKDDKDKEYHLAMWLLRRYRWDVGAFQGAAVKGQGGASSTEGMTGGRVVVFVNAVSTVMRLSSVLALLLESPSAGKVLSRVQMTKSNSPGGGGGAPNMISVDVLGLHSKLRQKERLKRIERFRRLEHAVLVCTDVAARGLDVPGIVVVAHYHSPRGAEVYVHRSGRTARAGRPGESIAFMGPGDAAQYRKIYRASGVEQAQILDICSTSFEISAAREAVQLASDLEGKLHRAAKQNNDRSWLQRTAQEADLFLDDDEDREAAQPAALKHALFGLYRQLQERVRRPPRRLGGGPLPRQR